MPPATIASVTYKGTAESDLANHGPTSFVIKSFQSSPAAIRICRRGGRKHLVVAAANSIMASQSGREHSAVSRI